MLLLYQTGKGMDWFNILKKVMIVAAFFFSVSAVHANSLVPMGEWKTIDDETNVPRSIIQIWLDKGQLKGKIKHIFYQPGEQINELCDKCPDEWHNQKKIGMTILWDFTQNPDNPLQWINGKILDPKTGKIYQCQLTLTETGQALKVRGYIIIPLLGRTQQWLRQTE